MKPLIGLNLDINIKDPNEARISRRYVKSIQAAGGIPLLIPTASTRDLSRILSTVNGVLLIGGLDYSPALYGEKPSSTVKELHAERQDFDLRLARLVLNRKMPVLGICGGHQLLNITLGGSLIQDLEEENPGIGATHRAANPPPYMMHGVSLKKGSRLSRIFRSEKIDSVLSSHHQAVKRLGKGLRATAHAADGVVEAIELDSDRFVVGVQWHPEGTPEASAPLFRAFIQAAKK